MRQVLTVREDGAGHVRRRLEASGYEMQGPPGLYQAPGGGLHLVASPFSWWALSGGRAPGPPSALGRPVASVGYRTHRGRLWPRPHNFFLRGLRPRPPAEGGPCRSPSDSPPHRSATACGSPCGRGTACRALPGSENSLSGRGDAALRRSGVALQGMFVLYGAYPAGMLGALRTGAVEPVRFYKALPAERGTCNVAPGVV
jgi:hypothetical protein